MASKELILTFLGTGAMKPSIRRSTTAIGALIPTLKGLEHWLFDCGEGTYRQMCIFNQKENDFAIPSKTAHHHQIRFGCNKLNKIFITHLHGDHFFGLMSVLLGASFEREQEGSISAGLEIYGPRGIGSYIVKTLEVCGAKVSIPLHVFELCDKNETASVESKKARLSVNALYPSGNVWTCVNESYGQIQASTISHNIKTLGYVYSESEYKGNINPNRVLPLLQQNREAIEATGKTIYEVLHAFKDGNRVVLPDATVLDPADRSLISETRKGRRISILGDTRSAYSMKSLVESSDVLVHEATIGPISSETFVNSPYTEFDYSNEEERAQSIKRIKRKGHCTAEDAGLFAKETHAKMLILDHISNRYDFVDDVHYQDAMNAIRNSAVNSFQSESVIIPNDLQTIVIEGYKRDLFNVPL